MAYFTSLRCGLQPGAIGNEGVANAGRDWTPYNGAWDGRLVLGLAVGARKEDYDVAGVEYRTRGRRLQGQLASLRDIWEEGQAVPRLARRSGPEMLVGGLSDVGYARMSRYADSYVHGG